ncbi:hypothetical protein GLAREA_05178 [Glarea lozoyensis ATCC 20868]|uniref:Uncharacterized protein n=1 Tax=Glarea lozoyensis (strain ATCC 20868 / MF5171) TaxID=1116229 RepID=S3DDP1_GLAL2|nr:uncharacterized protein GLAREA_05178 [Glarea lozoyensis ATCC 20868]EPE35840.1 hypothetical protein GLAREA_05178 [Glarea lozoyensis ATCC 20868]
MALQEAAESEQTAIGRGRRARARRMGWRAGRREQDRQKKCIEGSGSGSGCGLWVVGCGLWPWICGAPDSSGDLILHKRASAVVRADVDKGPAGVKQRVSAAKANTRWLMAPSARPYVMVPHGGQQLRERRLVNGCVDGECGRSQAPTHIDVPAMESNELREIRKRQIHFTVKDSSSRTLRTQAVFSGPQNNPTNGSISPKIQLTHHQYQLHTTNHPSAAAALRSPLPAHLIPNTDLVTSRHPQTIDLVTLSPTLQPGTWQTQSHRAEKGSRDGTKMVIRSFDF